MLTKLIKSQSGFSIVQGLMLSAAVAGMALVGTKLMTDQKMAEKGADSKDKVEQLHKMIYSILQNKDHCNATFTANTLTTPTSLLTSGLTKSLNSINTTGGPAFVANTPGVYNSQLMYMNNSVSINGMSILFPTILNDNYATLSITYGRMEKNDMGKRSGSGYGSQTIRKNISIKLQRENGNFEGCYATDLSNKDSVKEFCDSFALLTWDANQNICRYKDLKCNPGELFAGFDSTGTKKCYKVEQWMDMSNLVDPSPTSCIGATSVGLEQVGKKVKIVCSGTPPGPGVNCVGAWGACVAGSQTYSITTPASGGGTTCPYANGATQACASKSCHYETRSYSMREQACGQAYPHVLPFTNGTCSVAADCPAASGMGPSTMTDDGWYECSGSGFWPGWQGPPPPQYDSTYAPSSSDYSEEVFMGCY